MRNRRGVRAYEAISNGLIAVGSGDIAAARKHAAEVNRIAPGEPLALLLAAQSAQLAGDREAADHAFRTMASRADTKALGLHGLYVEAQRRDDLDQRPRLRRGGGAHRAVAGLGRPGGAGIPLRHRRLGRRAGALERGKGALDKAVYRRQRAVMLTARALAARRHRPRQRQGVCARSRQARPDLGAGGGARRAHARRGRRTAQSLAHRRQGVARQSASRSGADLRRTCASAMPRATASPASRRWSKRRPGHIEGALAVARAALDAREFGKARAALAPYLAAADPARSRC